MNNTNRRKEQSDDFLCVLLLVHYPITGRSSSKFRLSFWQYDSREGKKEPHSRLYQLFLMGKQHQGSHLTHYFEKNAMKQKKYQRRPLLLFIKRVKFLQPRLWWFTSHSNWFAVVQWARPMSGKPVVSRSLWAVYIFFLREGRFWLWVIRLATEDGHFFFTTKDM